MNRSRAFVCAAAALALAGAMSAAIRAGAARAQAPAPGADDPVDLPIESMPPAEQPPPASLPTARLAPEAAPGAPVPSSWGPSWQPRAIAELAALDKIADRAATLNVPVGGAIQFEGLSIMVGACVARPPDQAPNAAAFLKIADARPGEPGFTGWMLVDEPSVAMLQHPVYDVRVVGCH